MIRHSSNCRQTRQFVTVTRLGPQQADRKFSKLRPSDAGFWKKRGEKTLGIGHVFKYPYAYYYKQLNSSD